MHLFHSLVRSVYVPQHPVHETLSAKQHSMTLGLAWAGIIRMQIFSLGTFQGY